MRAKLAVRLKLEAVDAGGNGEGLPAASQLNPPSGVVVFNPAFAQHARAIRELAKRTVEDIVAIGWHLSEVRNEANHGEWLNWLEVEFGWSDQTARNLIHVHERSRDPKFKTVLNLNLPLQVLYQLSAPKAEKARAEIAERIEAGEKPSCTEVKDALKRATRKKKKNGADAVRSDQAVGDSDVDGEEPPADSADAATPEPAPSSEDPINTESPKASTETEALGDLEKSAVGGKPDTPIVEAPIAKAAANLAGLSDDELVEVLGPALDRLGCDGLCRALSEKLEAEIRDRVVGQAMATASATSPFAKNATTKLHVILRCAEQREPSAEDIRNMIGAALCILRDAAQRSITRSNIVLVEGAAKKPKRARKK
jgi:hypothetical protein